jgi:hypothetical protein
VATHRKLNLRPYTNKEISSQTYDVTIVRGTYQITPRWRQYGTSSQKKREAKHHACGLTSLQYTKLIATWVLNCRRRVTIFDIISRKDDKTCQYRLAQCRYTVRMFYQSSVSLTISLWFAESSLLQPHIFGNTFFRHKE